MSKRCPYCKSNKIGSFNDTVVCCAECHRVFGKSQLVDSTLFDQITESPETLAETLVYRYDGNGTWRSFLLYGYEFLTKEEAIVTTVAKLKEVCDE